MKLVKTMMIAGVICLLVAGSALAWGGQRGSNTPNCDPEQGPKTPIIEVITDVTGKTDEEIKDLCQELRDEDQTLYDYLVEEDLLDEVKAAILEHGEEALDQLLEAGKITSEQYDERLGQLSERIDDEKFFTPRRPRQGQGNGSRAKHNVILEATGLSTEELQELCQELREEGQTLYDYLVEEDLLDEVKAAIMENAEEALDQLLENGKLTSEQYAERLEQLTEKINDENFWASRPHKGNDRGPKGQQSGEKTRPANGRGSRMNTNSKTRGNCKAF